MSTTCQVPTGRICRAGVFYRACSTNKLPHVRFQLAEFAKREYLTRPVLRINCLMSGSNWQNLQSRSVLQGLFYEYIASCQVPTGRICGAGVFYKACSTNKLPHVRFQLVEFAEWECFTRPVPRINCLMSVSNWQNLWIGSVLQGLFYE